MDTSTAARTLASLMNPRKSRARRVKRRTELLSKIHLGLAAWFLVVASCAASGGITKAFRIDGPLIVFKTPEEIIAGVKQTQTILTSEELRKTFEESGIPTNNITQLEYSSDRRYLVVRGPEAIVDLAEEFLSNTSGWLGLQMVRARAFLKATADLDSVSRARAIVSGYWYPWMPIQYFAKNLLMEPTPSKARMKQFEAAYLRWKQYLESELRAYDADHGE